MRRGRADAVRVAAPSVGDAIAGTRFYEVVKSAGDMGALAVSSVRLAVRPPYSWVPDAIVEASLAFRRCIVPLALSVSVFMVALSILVFGNLLHMLGATDREAGGMWIAFTREVCAWITCMIFAGVAGSAVTSDLASRKIREELDALAVLGIDRVRTLVVPRVVAMTLAAPVLGMLAVAIAQGVNYAIAPGHLGIAPAVHRDSLISNIIPLDLYASILKYLAIGFFVGIVSCQKGLGSSGGSEGVGRAVNQTVIITFVGVWLFNSLYNLGYQTLFPETAVLRG
jgi:phospholipid/cholesterol/gamma-HCH transport system permease protein